MQNENFTVVFGWMCNELALKGNALLIYATIYGFSKDGISVLLRMRLFLTVPLFILTEKGYIIRNTKEINGVTFHEYRADLSIFQNFTGGKESLPGVVKKLYGDGKESLPNNINNNIDKSIVNSKESKKKFDAITYLDTIPGMAKDPEIKDVFVKFLEMRESIKHPVSTEYGLKQLIKQAWELGDFQKNKIIAVVNQSITNGYRGLFELKNNNNQIAPRTAVKASGSSGTNESALDFFNRIEAEELAKEAAT